MRAEFRPTGMAAAALTLLLSGVPLEARDAVRTVPPKALTVPPAETVPAPQASRPADPVRAKPERGELTVTVDRAKVIRLPERTTTVVIGNPAIADMAIQKNGVVVVTGKSYGVTNLIALDSGGNMLAESTVAVSAPSEALVVVQRGMTRESYSCTPACQPSVVLGDSTAYFADNRGQADARNQFATSR